jgi:hypothetical protein
MILGPVRLATTLPIRLLAAIGRHGQLMLVAGLIGGLAWPQAAGALRPRLTELIVALLFFAAIRVEPRAFRFTRATLAHDIWLVAAMQFLLPVSIAVVAELLGWSGPIATMLILIATASTISGTPPIAQMLGLSGGMALRLLVIGTLALPLTSLVPLALAFGVRDDFDVIEPALRLSAIILVATGGAWIVRTLLPSLSPTADQALAGVSALLLAIFVLALMDAMQPALLAAPLQVGALLAFTCLVSFGLQAAGALAYRRFAVRPSELREAGAVGVAAGNRNTALFLAALPASQMEPLMVLIGCYQIPMFLTPIVMRPFYRWLVEAAARS